MCFVLLLYSCGALFSSARCISFICSYSFNFKIFLPTTRRYSVSTGRVYIHTYLQYIYIHAFSHFNVPTNLCAASHLKLPGNTAVIELF